MNEMLADFKQSSTAWNLVAHAEDQGDPPHLSVVPEHVEQLWSKGHELPMTSHEGIVAVQTPARQAKPGLQNKGRRPPHAAPSPPLNMALHVLAPVKEKSHIAPAAQLSNCKSVAEQAAPTGLLSMQVPEQ